VSYEEFFAGYLEDPVQILSRTFSEVDGYDEMIFMTDMRLESHCEHHMVPIIGKAHVAYLPDRRVGYAKRLQIQERMTVQIADTDGSTRREFLAMIGRTGAGPLTNT